MKFLESRSYEERIREGEVRKFSRWMDLEKANWGLKANHDKNPGHHDPDWAAFVMRTVYYKVTVRLELDKKPFIIFQGLGELTQTEEIGIEEFSERFLPLSFKVKFSVPLLIYCDEQQKVQIEFIPVGRNQFSVKMMYDSNRLNDSFERKPTMESLPNRPFVFCSARNRQSGITDTVRRKFKRILDGEKTASLYFRQTEEERDAYCRSVDFRKVPFEELAKQVYGKDYGFPTLAASRIPSDIAMAIDKDIYRKKKIVLYGEQELFFNQKEKGSYRLTTKDRLGDRIEMRILETRQRNGMHWIDELFAVKGEVLCLGRSLITIINE